MKTIVCKCEASNELDMDEVINLDEDSQSLEAMQDGTFLKIECKNCGTVLRPEFDLHLKMPSRKLDVFLVPEMERISVIRGKKDVPKGSEILIGLPELFERIRIVLDGLNPEAVEIVKYYLQGKAEEAVPEGEPLVRYYGLDGERLSFRLYGLREGETGVLPVPRSSYEKTLSELAESRKRPPFNQVFKGSYRSIQKLAYELDE